MPGQPQRIPNSPLSMRWCRLAIAAECFILAMLVALP